MKKKIIVTVLLLILNGIGLFIIFNNQTSKEETVENQEIVIEESPIIEETKGTSIDFNELWNKGNSYNNSDYIGHVVFESELISEPVVFPKKELSEYRFYKNDGKVVTDMNNCETGACTLNDVYLRIDYKDMSYDLGGTCFMDYRNSLNDQNIIIYGHYYPSYLDANRDLFFTPLELLIKKENYEENKYVYLLLENEIRKYEIAYVYVFRYATSDYNDLQFFRTNYEYNFQGNQDIGYYQKYINNMENSKLYDTGVKLNTNDNTLTLQTCMDDPNSVEIVVAKYIETLKY